MTSRSRRSLTKIAVVLPLLALTGAVAMADESAIGAVRPNQGTGGTIVRVTGDDFGERRGKAWLEYADKGRTRKVKLKVARANWLPDRIVAYLPRAKSAVVCDVIVVPKGGQPIVCKDAFEIKAPLVTSAPRSGRPRFPIAIHGSFFGWKKGKVSLQWNDGARRRKAKCRVRSWDNEHVVAVLPKKLPADTVLDVVLENKVGEVRLDGWFTFGAQAPTTEIWFPPETCVAGPGTITVTGTAADPDGIAAVRVNGSPATTTDGFATWRAVVALSDGPNRIVVATEDSLGNLDPEADAVNVRSERTFLWAPEGMALDADSDHLWVSSGAGLGILTVDLGPGARGVTRDPFPISSPREDYRRLVFDGSRNRILGIRRDSGAVAGVLGGTFPLYSVNLASGAQTLISSLARGTGEQLRSATAVAHDPAGDSMLLTDLEADTLVATDLASGDRTVLSGPGVGSGPTMGGPGGVALRGDRILVGDALLDALVEIDPATGDRTIVSDATHGTGPPLRGPTRLAVDGDRAFVLLMGRDLLVEVDLATGNRSTVSHLDYDPGPQLREPGQFILDLDRGRALVTDRAKDAVIAFDLRDGRRSFVAGSTTGDGKTIRYPWGIALVPAADVLVVGNPSFDSLWFVDRHTGARTPVPSSRGSGTVQLSGLVEIAVDAENGRLYAAGTSGNTLSVVDLATGKQTVISGVSKGSGPAFARPRSITLDLPRQRVLILDEGANALFAVALSNGQRTVISDAATGMGPPLDSANDVLMAPAGDLVFMTYQRPREDGALLSVDLATGDRTVVSGQGRGVGPDLDEPWSAALDGDRVLVLNARSIFAVDPATGDRTKISGDGVGNGPQEWSWAEHATVDESRRVLYAASGRIGAVLAFELESGDRVVLSK